MSLDRLIEKIADLKNPTVAGLDPKLSYIPTVIKEEAFRCHGETLEGAAEALLQFNRGLIDALCDIVPAVKPQCAYYEMYGWPGVRALYETIRYAKEKGMFVITDGKRNDIGSTMEAYAAAHLGEVSVNGHPFTPFGSDALTVNGYLGSDGIQPLLEICRQQDTGIFVLVKTSNPSSGEVQDQQIDGRPVYRMMGDLCERWGCDLPGHHGYSGVGAVVGATYPGSAGGIAYGAAAYLFSGAGLWRAGGQRAGRAPRVRSERLGRYRQFFPCADVRVAERGLRRKRLCQCGAAGSDPHAG